MDDKTGDHISTADFVEQIRAALNASAIEDNPPVGSEEIQERRDLSAIVRREERLRSAVEPYFLRADLNVDWDDVIGNEPAKKALIAAIESPIRHKDILAHYGKKPTKGVVLYGPPGTGKTMLAKACATAVARLYGTDGAARMIAINGTDIQSPYVGKTESTIRLIFAYARAYQARYGHPLVVFIDEADAILPSRDGAGGRKAYNWEESNVAAFLGEMDGMEGSGAFVLLASNRPQVIDAAIMRDGRCDRKIRIERPDRNAARIIFERCFDGVPLASSPAWMASFATDSVFAPHRRLLVLRSEERGVDYLTLGDIVNGAMICGVVERAKEIACERDIAAGLIGGICEGDVDQAIADVFLENIGLDHMHALIEYRERYGISHLFVDDVVRGTKPISICDEFGGRA